MALPIYMFGHFSCGLYRLATVQRYGQSERKTYRRRYHANTACSTMGTVSKVNSCYNQTQLIWTKFALNFSLFVFIICMIVSDVSLCVLLSFLFSARINEYKELLFRQMALPYIAPVTSRNYLH